MYESGTCPKCGGPRDSKALYCAFCGVVFAKYSAEPQPPPVAPDPSPGAPPESVGLPAEAAVNPYRPPAAALYRARPPAPVIERDLDAGLASRGRRLLAHLLDSLILGISAVPVFFLLAAAGMLPEGVLKGTARADDELVLSTILTMMVISMVPVCLVNLYYLGQHGQTLGKKALSIRIVRPSGELATLGRLVVLRTGLPWIFGMVPFLGGMFGLADALCIFRDDRRCLHDHIADTIVVDA